jgi:hypothetical protein
MSTAKEEVQALLSKLPDDCSLEDIQYYLYVVKKVNHGLEVADSQGMISQDEVEQQLGKWVLQYRGHREQ